MVTVNFVCHYGWATGFPDNWSKITLGVFVRVFLDENNILINRVKQIAFPNGSGTHPIYWKLE